MTGRSPRGCISIGSRRSPDGIRQYYSEEEQEPDWSKEVEEGLTLGQYAKERALESAALYAAVENWAQRYDCALTEADRAEAAPGLGRHGGGAGR